MIHHTALAQIAHDRIAERRRAAEHHRLAAIARRSRRPAPTRAPGTPTRRVDLTPAW